MIHERLDVTQVNESARLAFLVGMRRAHLLLGSLALLIGAVFFAQPATASHVEGTYSGSFGTGGTVTFNVAQSLFGLRVLNFVADPDGSATTCSALTIGSMGIDTATATHTFTGGPVSGLSATGQFATTSGRPTASGTLTIDTTPDSCDRPSTTQWTASGPGATTSPAATATVAPTTTATATATPIRTATPALVPTNTLPKNGAPTAAIALSGLTLLELGYGLRLLSRRLQVRARAVPLFLLRKLARAQRAGRTEVEVMDGVYLVQRPRKNEGPTES